MGSNLAKPAALTALLDPSTHFRPPRTHTSHHRLVLVDLSRSRVSPIFTHSHFRRFSTCVLAVLGVSLVGVSPLSANVAVTVVRPEVISQRVCTLQRSNEGPLESSYQDAHDRTITANASKISYAVIWASTLVVYWESNSVITHDQAHRTSDQRLPLIHYCTCVPLNIYVTWCQTV